RVLVVAWTGDVHDSEIQDVDVKILDLLKQNSPTIVHVVSDFTGLHKPPSLLAFRTSKAPAERNFGWALTFGNVSPITRTILTVLSATFRVKHRFVASRAEALSFLARVDKTLAASDKPN